MSEEEDFSFDQVGDGFLRHVQFPVGLGRLAAPHGSAVGVGRCGDSVEVDLRLEKGTIGEVGVMPKGCVYTVACASALAALVRGRTLEGALQLGPQDIERELGGLPEDHLHCARLAVNTLGEAIENCLRRHGLAVAAPSRERSAS